MPNSQARTQIRKIAIIGAGPAGLTAAVELSQHPGYQVELYEATAEVGGMAKTITLWNHRVDLGPHRFFSSDPRVNKIWLEFAGRNYRMVNRLTRIFYRQKFFHYPLQLGNVIRRLGVIESFLCLASLVRSWFFQQKNENNFEAWIANRFGHRLFRIFFKTYSEKLWGIDCRDLSADFAAQRIKKFSFVEAIRHAIGAGRQKHKTLVDQFAYPLTGSGAIYEEMARRFVQNGGKIFFNSPIQSVLVRSGKALGIETNDQVKVYDSVISSMPLTQLVQRLENLPPQVQSANSKLRFRSTVIVYLLVRKSPFADQWIYVHSANLKCGRMTNFSNWSPGLNGDQKTSVLALEYWCNEGDPVWQQSETDFVRLAQDELVSTGLVPREEILEGKVYRIGKCYPMYEQGYQENLQVVEEHLRGIENLTVIGRYGSFKYNNQDHSILMGSLAAQNLMGQTSEDLWSLNSDYEYQESATISETGLEYR